MAVKRMQVRDEEGKVCTAKTWVLKTVGGFKIGFEVLSKGERYEAISDANCEQIAWYDVKTLINHNAYKIVEDIIEY
ncbi:MAG: hypothetical protein COB02_14265 [Candidatus Cloacimonadota bacterium]|nr:MAG: hypothetical protein COB02_14265 [Candidatus Cloacimonadota bacterium]